MVISGIMFNNINFAKGPRTFQYLVSAEPGYWTKTCYRFRGSSVHPKHYIK